MQTTDALEITASNYVERNQHQIVKTLYFFRFFSHEYLCNVGIWFYDIMSYGTKSMPKPSTESVILFLKKRMYYRRVVFFFGGERVKLQQKYQVYLCVIIKTFIIR
jgi:hypothetical protein